MDRTRGQGVYVKSLFRLLAFLQVPQTEVSQHLGLSGAFVSMMAKGQRPMPRRHLEPFEAFVWGHVRRKYDTYVEAIEQELGEGGWSFGHASDAQPFVFPEPPPDAPLSVQRWWAFHVRTCQLMDAWEVEVNPDPLVRAVGDAIRQLTPYGLLDHDKLREILLTPRRSELLAPAEQIGTHVHTLEAVDPRPMVARLRTALQPRPSPSGATTKRTRRR